MATKTQKEKATKTPASPRWSIGLFRNAKGKLVTVYVNAEGVPMPYEMKRVGDNPILFFAKYVGMKYSEARAQLIKDAAKKKIVDEIVEKPKAEKKAAPKKAAAKPKAKAAPKKTPAKAATKAPAKPKAKRPVKRQNLLNT